MAEINQANMLVKETLAYIDVKIEMDKSERFENDEGDI